MQSYLEWDEYKAKENYLKHGISFEEASEVFDDPYHIEYYDSEHSTIEECRYRIVGRVKRQVVVLLIYTPRNEKFRIISAREAKKHERRRYYDRRGMGADSNGMRGKRPPRQRNRHVRHTRDR